MLILAMCDNSSVLNTILFIKTTINIIFVIVPLILALFLTIDIAKNVFAKDDKDNQKNIKMAIKRIIYSLAIMFIPLLVNTFMSMISDYSKVAKCYDIATEAKVKELQEQEEADYNAKKAEQDKEKEKNAKDVSKENKKAEKESKAAEKKARTSSKKESSNTKIDGNFPNKYIQAKQIAEAAGGGKNCSDGHKTNCPLGDQTGNEVKTSKWRGGWTYVLRANNPAQANKAAACMEAAVKNNNIGYGQQGFSKWHGLWDYLKARGDWDVSTVNKKVSVSCCPLVAVCLKYAGYHPSNSLNCVPVPDKMKAAVYKAGSFSQVHPGKSLNLTNIKRGDILISSHHMAMAV